MVYRIPIQFERQERREPVVEPQSGEAAGRHPEPVDEPVVEPVEQPAAATRPLRLVPPEPQPTASGPGPQEATRPEAPQPKMEGSEPGPQEAARPEVPQPQPQPQQQQQQRPEPDQDLRRELDRALRAAEHLARDLDTYKRHAEARLASARQDAQQELLAELGDTLRSLETALDAAGGVSGPVAEGVALVLRGLRRVYDSHGLQRIPTAGRPFDPALHEALYTEPRPDLPRGTVVTELSPGFRAGQRVIKPAKVSVSS
jgi:molecular chaperone GrpE